MTSDLMLFLLKTNLAIAAAILLVLVLRKFIRTAFGAPSAYALWLVVPLASMALLLPPPAVQRLEPAQFVQVARRLIILPATAQAMLQPVDDRAPQPSLPIGDILIWLWIVVALIRFLIQAERQRRFVQSLGRFSLWDGVLWSDRPGVGPAVVGAFFPRIVVPADFAVRFTPKQQNLILAHEEHHLAVGDARINAAVTVLQCLFWFNPVLHLGAAFMRIDQEVACDAAVLARHPRMRRSYGEAMLKTQLAPFGPPLGCHWPASANKQLKERFTLLAHHRINHHRTLAGSLAVAILSVSASATAWATLPPERDRQVTEDARDNHSPLGRSLFEAVRTRDVAMVRTLIARGADVNAMLPGDGSPLIEAARNGEVEIARLLLTAGADPNLAVRGDGAPLIEAASSGSLATVGLLVERGAAVEMFVPDDETPLIKASQTGDLNIVTYLVERGANVKRAVPANPGEMRSPLGEARRNGHDAVVAYLTSKGA
jgi:beta-lactamase regulating signal transducer with metallopeptidase domain